MSAHAARVATLGAFLAQWRPLWSPRAFYGLPLPWEAAFPELARWIDAQPVRHGAAGAAEVFAWAEGGPPLLRELGREAQALSALSPLEGPPPLVPRRALDGATGKKQAQILAFAGATLAHLPRPGTLLDWCGGKAHLGRLVAGITGARLDVVERDAALCDAGGTLARRRGLDATFHAVDALGPEAARLASSDRAAVALHACGDLHGALIAHAEGPWLAVAPCCYLRALRAGGVVVSSAGARAGLTLDEGDLRLVSEAPSDAGRADADAVDRLQRYRLGVDAWLRARDGRPEGPEGYTPLPPCPPQWYALPFQEFCTRLVAHAGLPGPREDVSAFEAEGARRFEAVRRRDVLRALFRRALELWLVLDRAVRLEERGYAVQLGAFCPEGVTPRNLLLLARR